MNFSSSQPHRRSARPYFSPCATGRVDVRGRPGRPLSVRATPVQGAPNQKPRLIRADQPQIAAESVRPLSESGRVIWRSSEALVRVRGGILTCSYRWRAAPARQMSERQLRDQHPNRRFLPERRHFSPEARAAAPWWRAERYDRRTRQFELSGASAMESPSTACRDRLSEMTEKPNCYPR